MTIRDILAALFISFGFVIWVILGKRAGLPPAWTSTTVACGTCFTVLVLSGSSIEIPTWAWSSAVIATIACAILLAQSAHALHPTVPPRELLLVVTGGIINGIAVYFYSQYTTGREQAITAQFMITVSTMMAVWAPTLAWVLIPNSALNIYHGMGIGTATATIYLMSR